jgi:superfamily II DNA or RNA helicase/diadenosine tetraphosphate (Ap4A) HIT family hydrolase
VSRAFSLRSAALSVFLSIPAGDWIAENAFAFAIRDRYPVSPGHTLVITRRVVADWFGASAEERTAIFELVETVKQQLDVELQPDGYNVGFNAGAAAGQTVPHLHVHVIPRYRGDMDDPRGGVRHVIPSKGNYLRNVEPLATGGIEDPFSRHVLPLFETAREIAIVAAFVQASGLHRIKAQLHAAVARGAKVRVLTGDYLDITQASALQLLLDWQEVSRGDTDAEGHESDEELPAGTFDARIIETGSLPPQGRSFHPKSWRFEAADFGIAFVGSSNLSRSALEAGIEWNLRVDRDRDRNAYERVRHAFDALWQRARALDAGWVDAYAARARRIAVPLPAAEIETEDALRPAPDPHEVQVEALAALRKSREDGRRRALVVLATGLGKTWLAAYDLLQLRDELEVKTLRVLFVAHRRELLRQAAETYRRLMLSNVLTLRVGWFLGDKGDLSADIVFASVAKLARKGNVEKLARQHFDYVVIDEVHHAAAGSYRAILDNIDPTFLLGLTATPDRADANDILGLFDDHVAYRADIARGVEVGRLVPFRYYGVRDEIDYENIPWRNRRFDPEQLAAAAQTETRMETLWRAWQAHAGTRTLVFCCSVAHAVFVKRWLESRGVRARAVYSGAGSDDRDEAIRELDRGAIDALCSVDIFNEGVDVPKVDRVVMLRPTESGVVFLQQLGRGLRAAGGKSSVTVIDFVGNHSVFLERLRALLSLAGERPPSVREVVGTLEPVPLPAGCSVELSIEAKELLARLFLVGGSDAVERVYRELRLERGQRPSAGELERMGYRPAGLRKQHGSWVDFVRSEKDLARDEERAVDAVGAFLRELETTPMTKCFKMVTLEAMLEAGALTTGLGLRDLALRSHSILRRSPELFADVADDERAVELNADTEKRWLTYWRSNPIAAWTGAKNEARVWFRIEADRFVPAFAVPDDACEAFARLTRELVDYRLAQYRRRKQSGDVRAESFVCRVLSNQRDPILKLPTTLRETLPLGEVDARVDGALWQFRLMKQFCNVARPAGTERNALPDLLRRWFGPSAGQPGTAFDVHFRGTPDGYWVEPVGDHVVALEPRSGVAAYPDLRAAAGHGIASEQAILAERVMLPLEKIPSDDLFAVRVSGSSMDGGKAPLRDGDWAVMRLARRASVTSVLRRVVLVQVPGDGAGMQYQIKRLEEESGRYRLTSDNPDGPSFDATSDTTVIALLDQTFHPENLGPAPSTVLSSAEIAAAFGVDAVETVSGRYGGHLFVFVDRKGMLEATDRVREPRIDRRPGETAFVLAKKDEGAYRYLGVGRWLDDARAWSIAAADFDTWRAWGDGREISRALPPSAAARAQVIVDALLGLPESERFLQLPGGARARVLGPSARGGFRIDGGDGKRLAERSVSLTDLAWVVVAADDVRDRGGILDEARVNLLRYLEGTPKSSTRWIDTPWAIAAHEKTRDLVADAPVKVGQTQRVHDEDGRAMDASFTVEAAGSDVAIVFESGGGTRGTESAQNRDYRAGLTLLLERIKRAGLRIGSVELASSSPRAAKLSADERRVRFEGREYPLEITDAEAMRNEIGRAVAAMGRPPEAKGSGNSDKRLRIVVARPRMSGVALAGVLAGTAGGGD